MTNLIMNFMMCKKRAPALLRRLDPSLTDSQIKDFQVYVKNLKNVNCSYFNIEKLKSIWFPQNLTPQEMHNHRLIRTASYYFIRHKLPQSLLTSKKLSHSLKEYHLTARHQMVHLISSGTPAL